MNPVEMPLELDLKAEARHRELLDMYQNEEWGELLAAAELLNEALKVQQAMTRWMAKEAADNLAEAWQATRAHLPVEHDGSAC